MSDAAEPTAKPFRLQLVATLGVAGLLWLADGRLWPSMDTYASDVLWLFLFLQMATGGWLQKFRLGRVLAVPLYGAYLWLAAEWTVHTYAEAGERRSFMLLIGGLFLALIVGSVAWERVPSAWRAGLAAKLTASRTARAGVFCLFAVLAGGLVWWLVGAVAGGISPAARGGLTGLLLAMAGGMALALWRLEGWPRILAVWGVLSLAWIGLMTGIATAGSLAEIGVGGWLLAIVPPIIAGAVLALYRRAERGLGKSV